MFLNKEEKWLLDEKYGGEKCAAFFTDLQLLQSGTHLAYLIGSVPFLDCKIYLDSHPLIPRPETEFWVEKLIKSISHDRGLTPTREGKLLNKTQQIEKVYKSKKRKMIGVRPLSLQPSSLRVLDLCAGSGCIGVAVARAFLQTVDKVNNNEKENKVYKTDDNIDNNQEFKLKVDFSEIDLSHKSTIEKNLQENGLNVTDSKVFIGDLFEKVDRAYKYDFILSNPPYIDPKSKQVAQSVFKNEPHLALFTSNKGLHLIEKIIRQAPNYLAECGQLWIEHDPEQVKDINIFAKNYNYNINTCSDQYGVERYSILMLQ